MIIISITIFQFLSTFTSVAVGFIVCGWFIALQLGAGTIPKFRKYSIHHYKGGFIIKFHHPLVFTNIYQMSPKEEAMHSDIGDAYIFRTYEEAYGLKAFLESGEEQRVKRNSRPRKTKLQ